ncbi:MAG: hypothetical protein KC425_26360, partial [Anaerolineales bacterium]|nr:hypothetical protein [Anaerolineales bacterium]
ENIAVVENGTPLELDENSLTICPRLPGGYVFVDGAAVGDTGWSIVREREKLAENGFFIAVVKTNDRGDLLGQPQFVSHGFANLDDEELVDGAVETIARVVRQHAGNPDGLTGKLESALSRYLYDETRKRPFVEVVVQ